MDSGGGFGGVDGSGESSIHEVLQSLKSRGCSLLVVGEVAEAQSRRMGSLLFGSPARERDRVLVQLAPTRRTADWFPGDVGPADAETRVVDVSGMARSGAVGVTTSTGPPGPFDRPRTGDADGPPTIEDLVERVSTAVTALGPTPGEREPGHLRLGVYPLDVVVRRFGAGATRSLVARLSAIAREHRGMAHLHLPMARSDGDVDLLGEPADAVVTLRKDAPRSPPAHRWDIDGYGETEWVPLG